MNNSKKIISLIGGALSLVSVATFAAAPNCTGFPGLNMTCGKGTLPSLKGIIITLNGTTITGDSTVFGKLALNQGATLQGKLTVGGVLVANDSTIEGDSNLGSTSMTFNHTTTANLTVTKEVTPAVIRLANNTLVKGNINFQSGNGTVYEDASSKITGQVIGGKIVRK